MANKVCVVTGANKGIGFHIARGLCRALPDARVLLCSRDLSRGEEAVRRLAEEGLGNASLHQLDISDATSVEQLRGHIAETYGGLDVLVNNAGMAFKAAATEPFAVQARESVRVNFLGTMAVSDALIPLMRPHGRVVNVGSRAGKFSILSPALRARVMDPALTQGALTDLIGEFVAATEAGTHQEQGWPNTAYGTSKVGALLVRAQCHRHS